MSAVAERRARSEEGTAKFNFWFQLVAAIPILLIFGFSVLNVAIVVLFLSIAVARLFRPHDQRLRHTELALAVVFTIVWLVVNY